MLREGFTEVILYTDEGDIRNVGLRMRGGSGTVPEENVTYFEAADGNDYPQSRSWTWEPVLSSRDDLAAVRDWRDAGKNVAAIVLGPRPFLWREYVPARLEDASEARGALGGDRLRMTTTLLDADVRRATDFFAGADLSGGAQVALPVEGLLLRIEAPPGTSFDAEARSFDGTVLASTTADPLTFLELPANTFYVYLSGPASTQADRDAFALVLVSEDADSATFRAFGKAYFEEFTYNYTLLGKTYQRVAYRMKPTLTALGYVLPVDELSAHIKYEV